MMPKQLWKGMQLVRGFVLCAAHETQQIVQYKL